MVPVASTTLAPHIERTAANPDGQFSFLLGSMKPTAVAIMEIRRRSGLTWQELDNLFAVPQRSVHHWANGKPAGARHGRKIRQMLAAIRHLDRGSQLNTRALLLNVDQAMGTPMFDLLQDEHFNEAIRRVAAVHLPELRRTPLSHSASEARRPPEPSLLLRAEQNRPDFPTKARTVRAKRTPTTVD